MTTHSTNLHQSTEDEGMPEINTLDSSASHSSIKKSGLLARLAVAATLLVTGATGCADNQDTTNNKTGAGSSAKMDADLEKEEEKIDAIREQLGMERLNNDAPWAKGKEASSLTPEQRRRRLEQATKEVEARLHEVGDGNPHMRILKRTSKAPYYESDKKAD